MLQKMKTIGLIGGMSWKSTVTYYEVINRIINKKLGGLHSAKIILYSVDFHEIEECQRNGDWDKSARILSKVSKDLEGAGADFVVICTNTMHKIATEIREQISIPLLHIAEATAQELVKNNMKKVALLGTKYTMEQDFYKEKIIDKGIEILIPNKEDIEEINKIIFEELCLGKINPISKEKYLKIIEKLRDDGAQGVILGCTEIGLLIKSEDTTIPLFDTALIHGEKAALLALEEE